MAHYFKLSQELEDRIQEDRNKHLENPYACKDTEIIRRDNKHDNATLWRPAFVRDVEKIMHNPYYNRYADKTQVFSLYKNDDITRRLLHVQLVARIARNIGRMLNLNLDLIEAIALGHDIGHTPFGHAGERKLSELYHARTGRYFNHNIQSARVLDTIFPVNMSLQVLDGIICHNGEMEMKEYRPRPYSDFETFEKKMESCYISQDNIEHLVPSTLEACVMRVSDIIAYLGKDRQDAQKLNINPDGLSFVDRGIGTSNAEIIHNMTVNIVENSYGKPYLAMNPEFFDAFSQGKKENKQQIYMHDVNVKVFDEQIYPMFDAVFERLLKDYLGKNRNSIVYTHHINYIKEYTKYYGDRVSYEEQRAEDIIVDYIASMTDDYFVDLYEFLFPNGKHRVQYIGYFEKNNTLSEKI